MAGRKTMSADDLAVIGEMVVAGLRDRTRDQQNFPVTETSIFKKGERPEARVVADSPKSYREQLTEKLIAQLKAGTAPWQKPWNPRQSATRLPYNPFSQRPYRGANSLHLTLTSHLAGYADPRWATYRQAAEHGWQVQKGQKGTLIEFWKFENETTARDARGAPVVGADGRPAKVRTRLERPKVFRAVVFNAAQMDNVPELPRGPRMYEWDPLAKAEGILADSGARIIHDQTDGAFYQPRLDQIHLPAKDQFPDPGAYYATALHELGHWSGHETRLARDLAGSFGSADYAREELRAELASYFLADKIGIAYDPERHASYVGSWIRALESDHNEIFRAARDAERITEYVIGLSKAREKDTPQALAYAEICRAKGLPEAGVQKVIAATNELHRRLDALGESMPLPGVVGRAQSIEMPPVINPARLHR